MQQKAIAKQKHKLKAKAKAKAGAEKQRQQGEQTNLRRSAPNDVSSNVVASFCCLNLQLTIKIKAILIVVVVAAPVNVYRYTNTRTRRTFRMSEAHAQNIPFRGRFKNVY